MHDHLELDATRVLARPSDDERLGLGIEVPLVERRGVHRVEELRGIAQLEIDHAALAFRPVRSPRVHSHQAVRVAFALGYR